MLKMNRNANHLSYLAAAGLEIRCVLWQRSLQLNPGKNSKQGYKTLDILIVEFFLRKAYT